MIMYLEQFFFFEICCKHTCDMLGPKIPGAGASGVESRPKGKEEKI